MLLYLTKYPFTSNTAIKVTSDTVEIQERDDLGWYTTAMFVGSVAAEMRNALIFLAEYGS